MFLKNGSTWQECVIKKYKKILSEKKNISIEITEIWESKLMN